jgi:hypothetical protein
MKEVVDVDIALCRSRNLNLVGDWEVKGGKDGVGEGEKGDK